MLSVDTAVINAHQSVRLLSLEFSGMKRVSQAFKSPNFEAIDTVTGKQLERVWDAKQERELKKH